MKKFFLFIFLTTPLALLSLLWVGYYLYQAPLSFENQILFELSKGDSAKTVSQKLYQKNLVPHPVIAEILIRLNSFDKNLKAGEYQIEPHSSLKNILELLTSGKVLMHRLTLPEGLTTAQMLKMIENEPLLTGQISEPTLEGEMLPETYTFVKGETKNKIIRQAKNAMQKALENAWQNRTENLPLQNKNDLLILASIIEKETGVSAERARISSVFVNRLNIGMPLQTDPTVIYAITKGKSDLGRTLHREDMEIDSPFNTYRYKGLPPTPICNPGTLALEAAANPEKNDFLYFVADGKGGHRFSKTLSEHNKNIKLWLQTK